MINTILIIIEVLVIVGGLIAVRHYYAMWETKRPSLMSLIGSGFTVLWRTAASLAGRKSRSSAEKRLAGALLLVSQLVVVLGIVNIVTYIMNPLPNPPPTPIIGRLVSLAIAWLLSAIAAGVFADKVLKDVPPDKP